MNMKTNELVVLQKFLTKENYLSFVNTIGNGDSQLISMIDTTPIDNYTSSIVNEKDYDTFKALYQNIRYYLRQNLMYTPKIEEGMAIVLSKAAMINYSKSGSLNNYVALGDYSSSRDIRNPFEELSRLLLCSIKEEDYSTYKDASMQRMTFDKLKHEGRTVKEVLNLAFIKDGVSNLIKCYCYKDIYGSMCEDLEYSNVTSSDIRSATTKANKGVLLEQMDRMIDIFYNKVNYSRLVTGVPSSQVSDTLKTRFENKVIYAKRNIGIYEKTKKLTK